MQIIDNIYFFHSQSNFIAVCSGIPDQTTKIELQTFLSKFGVLGNLWIEEKNGYEDIQALAFFMTKEGLNKAVTSKNQLTFKSSIISIERGSVEFVDIAKIRFHLLSFENKMEERKYAINLLLDYSIIRRLYTILHNSNKARRKIKEVEEQLPLLSKNDLLLSKYICDILLKLLTIFKDVEIQEGRNLISNQLFVLISYQPLQQISRSHTSVIQYVMANDYCYSIRSKSQLDNILIMSRLLEHSNIDIQQDAISIIGYIVNHYENCLQIINENQFYSDLKDNGVIQLIYDQCLQNGQSQQIKDEAAIILGQLLRKQNIEINMRKLIIEQLKKSLINENNSKRKVNIIKVIRNLTAVEENINEIESENFIQTITELSNSDDVKIKLNSLYLLLLLSQHGLQYEQQIRNSISDLGFLNLIGMFEMDQELIINQTMKWNNSEQMMTINKIISLRKQTQQFIDGFHEIQNQLKQLKQIIINQINIICQEIEQTVKNKEDLSLLTVGIINSIFYALNEKSVYLGLDMDFWNDPQLSDKILKIINVLPLKIIKNQHLKLLTKLIGKSQLNKYNQLNHGVHLILIRLLKHHSTQIIRIALTDIQQLINTSSFIYNSEQSAHQENYLEIPQQLQIQLFDQFEKEGTIEQIRQCLSSIKDNDDITEQLCELLAFIYRDQNMPLPLLQQILRILREFIEIDILQRSNSESIFNSLQNLSLKQENHDEILQSGIIQCYMKYVNNCSYDNKHRFIKFILVYLEHGNSQNRQIIRSLIPVKQFSKIILRQFSQYLFSKVDIDVNVNNYDNEYQQLVINKKRAIINNALKISIFTLIAWCTEEEVMNQIVQVRNEIIRIEEKQDLQDDLNDINKNKNRYWGNIEKMILLVKDYKDFELQDGIISFINEVIYQILYFVAKRMNEQEISELLTDIQKFVNNTDSQLAISIITKQFCQWLNYLIQECHNNNIQQNIEVQIFKLIASIAQFGQQVATQLDENHLKTFFVNSNLIKQLEQQVNYSDINVEELSKEEIINQKMIGIQAAIGYCCIDNEITNKKKTFKNCSEIFKEKLRLFNKEINSQLSTNKKQSTVITRSVSKQPSEKQQIITSSKVLNNKTVSVKNNNVIQSSDFELVGNILYAIGINSLNTSSFHKNYIDNQIYELILPFIHINCNCDQNISLPESPELTKLISKAYFVLSEIIRRIQNQKKVKKFDLGQDILYHPLSIIFNFDNINNNNNSNPLHSLKTSDIQNMVYIPLDLVLNAVKFLRELICYSVEIMYQVVNNLQIMDMIVNIALHEDVNTSDQFLLTRVQYHSMYLIFVMNNYSNLNTVYYKFNETNQFKLICKFMFCSGCGSNVYDDLIAVSIGIVDVLFEILQQEPFTSNCLQTLETIKERLEIEGTDEEIECLLFHSNIRENININKRAKTLKYNINYEANKEIVYIDDDGSLVLNDEEVDYIINDNEDDDDNDDF